MQPDSPLAERMILSPNRTTPRQGQIKGIIPHCVVGQASALSVANMFASKTRGASSNYVIGVNGEIIQCVPEKDRAWCSGGSKTTPSGWTGKKWDHWAISIECASDNFDPYWMNDKVLDSLIRLSADICKRNGIPKLLWQGNPALVGAWDQQNVSAHRWHDFRQCPGDYLYNRMSWYVDEVNKLLEPPKPAAPPVDTETLTYEEFRAYMNQYREMMQAEPVSMWANDDVEWAIAQGLLKGDGNSIMAFDWITREQVAALLHRMFGTVLQK